LAAFADDVVFEFNGRGTGLPSMSAEVQGKEALRPILKEFIDNFRFSDWQEVSLVVEGDKAALHWRANVTFTRNGRSARFDVFDFITLRDGKFVDFRQATDTARVQAMIAR